VKRTHQIAITSLLAVVFIVWQAPASLIGALLQQATHRLWNLAEAQGTLWNGQGVVVGKQAKDPRQAAFPRLSWKLAGLQDGGLFFQIQAGGQSVGNLKISWNGWQANLRGLSMEARDVSPLLPGILNKGDWQGLLSFRQLSVQGDWHSTRMSQLDVEWLNAATGLMPKGQLGSFVLKGHSENAGMSFSITSQDGPLVISGQGSHSVQQGLQFAGELTDNAGVASQFPGFLSAYLQPTGAPNRYTLQVSHRAL
jgi:general secretion pathway protein N